MVAGKLVDEQEQRAAAGFLVIELDAVAGRCVRHATSPHKDLS
jgi:hypothetical protein